MNKARQSSSLYRKLTPLGLILVSMIVALIFGEFVVRFIVNPNDFLYASVMDDPVLGHRIEPYTTGHDALGFRNREVPEQADVVAIGDSMTYGVSATREGSWPYQLGGMLDKPVYNMALGGYGPLQYLHLAQDQAKKLKPKLLLVGFYFGNDLMDSYHLAHGRPHWYAWRESTSDAIGETEYDRALKSGPSKRFETLRNWLARHSVLYSMLRVTLLPSLAAWEQDRMATQVSRESQMLWSDPANPNIRTIFSPQLRLSALDADVASVREGLHITHRAFASLRSETEVQRVQLLLVLIPTKERVYCNYLHDTQAQIPVSLDKLCRAEERINEELRHFLSGEKIDYIDVTGVMESKVREHIQLYPPDSDGHPLAMGYNVIARAVYGALQASTATSEKTGRKNIIRSANPSH